MHWGEGDYNQQPDREHEQTTVGQVPDRHRPPVLAEAGVGLGLGGVLDVRVVQQVLGAEGEGGEEGETDLDAEEDLLDGDGGAPVLLLVEDGEADGARGVDVRVEQRRHELHLDLFKTTNRIYNTARGLPWAGWWGSRP